MFVLFVPLVCPSHACNNYIIVYLARKQNKLWNFFLWLFLVTGATYLKGGLHLRASSDAGCWQICAVPQQCWFYSMCWLFSHMSLSAVIMLRLASVASVREEVVFGFWLFHSGKKLSFKNNNNNKVECKDEKWTPYVRRRATFLTSKKYMLLVLQVLIPNTFDRFWAEQTYLMELHWRALWNHAALLCLLLWTQEYPCQIRPMDHVVQQPCPTVANQMPTRTL